MRIIQQKSFWYKGKPFETERVRTGSYLWHLTCASNRLRIATEGILPIHGLVFASNVNDNINEMWHWDTEMECLDGEHLDYWRIGVRKAGCRWYSDINLDCNFSKGRYVCTPSSVPVEAITLFKHDDALIFNPGELDEYGDLRDEHSKMWEVKRLKGEFEQLYIKRASGVANCSLRQLPLKRVFI